jgi:hypothetical protein
MDHAGYLSPACLAAAQQMLAEHNAQNAQAAESQVAQAA